jgi:predicted nucleic acid-binding protein
MPAFCLDTSAILTLRDDEPGAERVAMLLEGLDPCFACFMTRMEVLYRVWKDEGERSGRLAYEQLQSLPIQWVDQIEPLLLEASRIKALHRLSVAASGSGIRGHH